MKFLIVFLSLVAWSGASCGLWLVRLESPAAAPETTPVAVLLIPGVVSEKTTLTFQFTLALSISYLLDGSFCPVLYHLSAGGGGKECW